MVVSLVTQVTTSLSLGRLSVVHVTRGDIQIHPRAHVSHAVQGLISLLLDRQRVWHAMQVTTSLVVDPPLARYAQHAHWVISNILPALVHQTIHVYLVVYYQHTPSS